MLPGFFYSSYRQTAYASSVIITMEQYQRLMETVFNGGNRGAGVLPKKPPKQRLLVRLTPGATLDEREALVNGIRNFIKGDITTTILETQSLMDDTSIAITLLDIFFIVVSGIAIVLSFFVLWLSFTANVRENSWQFGVLRSLGLTSNQVIRMYIYEALSVIISGIFLGSIVGILVAITLTLEFNIFMELPFSFDFPVTLFFIVLSMSFVVAIIGSYIPARAFRLKPIASTLKGL